MSKSHHYAARVTWDGGAEGTGGGYRAYPRNHEVRIEGKAPFTLTADPLFLGDAAELNPEDCLLAALSSCHLLSYLALAAREGLTVLRYEDRAEGTMVFEGGGGRFTEVTLRPVVTLAAGADAALAERLHGAANEICFIANSVNFPVGHEAEIRHA